MTNEIQKVASPYAVPAAPAANGAAGQNDLAVFAQGANDAVKVSQAAAVAEAIVPNEVAKRFPRDERSATDKLLNACMRPALAQQAVYEYARGGQPVTGASIRLAEAAARAWGNLRYGFKELSHDKLETTALAYAYDLESNLRAERSFTVSHVRHTKRGDTLLTDPRDIYETVANQAARRVRACILELLPGDVIDAAIAQCEETTRATADCSPAAMQKLVKAFEEYAVSKSQIEARIQRRLDTITPAQVLALRKIYVSLRDGMSKPEDWFDQKVVEAQVEERTVGDTPADKPASGLAAAAAKAAATAQGKAE